MTTADPTTAATDLVETFRAKVEPLGVRVDHVAGSEGAAELIGAAARKWEVMQVFVSAELEEAAPALVARLRELGLEVTACTDVPTALDAPLGISLAARAVAETGSVMLAERSLEDRAVAMVTEASTVICRSNDLVERLDDIVSDLRAAATRPGGAGYATLVTGPSRTADIEMSLTVGVQGPSRVAVVFVDALT